jgi:hypothetical protein
MYFENYLFLAFGFYSISKLKLMYVLMGCFKIMDRWRVVPHAFEYSCKLYLNFEYL